MHILEHYNDKINGVLETFDRMIINGYLLCLQNPRHFLFYLIQNHIQLKDFKPFALQQTHDLCTHIDHYLEELMVPLQYLSSTKINKDEIAKAEFEKDISKMGLIKALSTVELCKTMTVVPNHETKKLEIVSRSTKCKHYYLYFNDEHFGWMFLKIQTWFPYNVQIYINGREYLSKLLDTHGIGYERYDNSFSYIEDFDKAQELADNILNKKLSDSLDAILKPFHCLLPSITEAMNHTYYWCIDQCEFATDINFKNRKDLSVFYKTLVETSYFTFSSEDIYSFFGRNISRIATFKKGEIISDLRHRYQGYRIKFKMNNNQIKMYDKGNNLRMEVTINNPRDFKILKEKEIVTEEGKLEKEKKWLPMGKSIANLYRYVEISKAIIKRYMEALPEIDDSKVPLKELEKLSTRKEVKNRRYTGFNILNEETLTLFKILSGGEYLIHGFDNKKIRKRLYQDSDSKKNIGRMTRMLSKLRAHGIIKKVARKNTYYLTTLGRTILSSILLYTGKELLN
jgi:hypothetical protein